MERQNNIRHLRIGLTGNIGSGKSAVARLFAEHGVPTFDADHVGHALLDSDDEIKEKVLKTFGEKILIDRKINRPALAKIVFDDPRKRARLEQILHPAISETINERIMDLPNVRYAVVEGALLFEAGIEKNFDYIILVKADRKIAIDRAVRNLNLTKSEVTKRMNTQIPQNEKEKLADFVIVNNGTVEELRHRVNLLHSIILSLSANQSEP